MRIIGTVVLLLIAGIVRSTDAQSHEHATNPSCLGNARSAQNFRNCYSPILGEILESRSGVGGVDAAIATYCGRIEIINNCFETFGESSKICLGSETHVAIDALVNVTLSVLRFPCANPTLMKELSNTTDQQCITFKLQAATAHCGQRFMTDLQVPSAGFFNNETCSYTLTSQKCAVELLEDCEDKRFSRALESLFKYINDDLPCENLPKSPKSQAPPDSITANIS